MRSTKADAVIYLYTDVCTQTIAVDDKGHGIFLQSKGAFTVSFHVFQTPPIPWLPYTPQSIWTIIQSAFLMVFLLQCFFLFFFLFYWVQYLLIYVVCLHSKIFYS